MFKRFLVVAAAIASVLAFGAVGASAGAGAHHAVAPAGAGAHH